MPVSYKGAAPALQDVIAGHVQLMFATSASVVGHFESRDAAAAGGDDHQAVLADARAADHRRERAAGLRRHHLAWPGRARRDTPKEIVDALAAASSKALAEPETRRALADLGVEIVGGSPQEFAAYIKSEIPKWTAVVKMSGAKLE